VHDLKHTLGYRLRAAGVSFEDRQAMLGHKAAHITTHYSAADISNLIACAESVCDLASRNLPHSPSCGRQEARKWLKMLVEREGLEPSTPAL
jgi:hypothetical protein